MGAPRKPCSAIRSKSSRGKGPCSSHSRIWGRISASAKARTLCWTRRFSSVSAKSTMAEILATAFVADVRGARDSRPSCHTATMDEPVTAVIDVAAAAPHLSPVLRRYFDRAWDHGEWRRLCESDRRDRLDFASGIAVPALRHRHARVTAAIDAQADRLRVPSGAIGYSEPVVTLAR